MTTKRPRPPQAKGQVHRPLAATAPDAPAARCPALDRLWHEEPFLAWASRCAVAG